MAHTSPAEAQLARLAAHVAELQGENARLQVRFAPKSTILSIDMQICLRAVHAAYSASSAMAAVAAQPQARSALLCCVQLLCCLQLCCVQAVPVGVMTEPFRPRGVCCRQRRPPQKKECRRAPAARRNPSRPSRPRHPSAASTATAPCRLCRPPPKPSTGAPASPGAEQTARAMSHSPHCTDRIKRPWHSGFGKSLMRGSDTFASPIVQLCRNNTYLNFWHL